MNEKCNSIVPKGRRNYSCFSFKSSIFIKTGETLRQSARGGSPTATSLLRKGGFRELAASFGSLSQSGSAQRSETEGF